MDKNKNFQKSENRNEYKVGNSEAPAAPGETGSVSAKRRGKESRFSQQSIRVGQKGSHLPHLPRSSGGFLGFVLPNHEEAREVAAYSEPQTAERLHQAYAFSYANAQAGSPVPDQGYLDHCDRSERCISAWVGMCRWGNEN